MINAILKLVAQRKLQKKWFENLHSEKSNIGVHQVWQVGYIIVYYSSVVVPLCSDHTGCFL
jgi:hypothetical protein